MILFLIAQTFLINFIWVKESNETETACFKIDNKDPKLPDKPLRFSFDYKQKNNNKLVIYTDNKKKCLGLKDSYWTDIYKGSILSSPYQIQSVNCGSEAILVQIL